MTSGTSGGGPLALYRSVVAGIILGVGMNGTQIVMAQLQQLNLMDGIIGNSSHTHHHAPPPLHPPSPQHPPHLLRYANYKPQKLQPPPSPPLPPKPPKKPTTLSLHGESWEDPYVWVSQLHDRVAMRHMDVYMEQEEKYTEAVMSDTERLQSKLQSEMASRRATHLSTPPLRWGPWLYYWRVEEGKQYPVLCQRLASLHEEFISQKSPSAGFDFTSGKRIEQKLLDYNQEAERFGGYAYEELSEVSPDHWDLAYTMYDKDNDLAGSCSSQRAQSPVFVSSRSCFSNNAWAKL
ncbi:uncharacterized protein Fot_05755 [Forsythia ovata]|uniref:Peptidase S9A N-terminal domain-containing protein n=1 Tax=Forsythia ovata TaxID=205694 RepID=A0ABD1WR14_9LAMI